MIIKLKDLSLIETSDKKILTKETYFQTLKIYNIFKKIVSYGLDLHKWKLSLFIKKGRYLEKVVMKYWYIKILVPNILTNLKKKKMRYWVKFYSKIYKIISFLIIRSMDSNSLINYNEEKKINKWRHPRRRCRRI